ncbi:aldo/keto reductase [Actinoplanes sp. TRM 88003]|uniref:Aldo/keto reductase n=1 Tax=Paractinoplanes aksuensis TaxID=2939490 RepID=A0ABT1E3Z8_9ACTN|nr:aldo/keto reductase [Actinoplanes aksuensis]MCO8277861.1 aldo/keto reductase [Actinoplanes aksuensis]
MITAEAAGTWKLGDQVVNRMGFGSMRLTPNADRDAAIRVLRRAVELGVNHIDTAAFYVTPGGILDHGTGPKRYATELIREALFPYDKSLFLATKVGPGLRPDGEWETAVTLSQLRAQVEENLRRLQVDRLDLVNLRLTSRTAPVGPRFEALASLRDEGLIRHLGISNATLAQIDEAAAVAPLVSVQNSFAVDLQRDASLVAEMTERGIAFVPFFAIAGPGREDGPTTATPDAVREIALTHHVSEHQVRLAWTLHQGDNVLAIPGTGDEQHLLDNIAAGARRFSEEELARLA